MSIQPHAAFSAGRLGPIKLRNRIVKCGTNEGMSRDGLVTDRLIDWHREFAAGGVGMTTLSYCAVEPRGKTFPHQVTMTRECLPGLQRFTDAMHAEGAAAAIQLGHAGWFANPKASGEAPIGPSRQFSPHAQTFSRAMNVDDFAAVTASFAEATRLAVEAGFDAIEVHLGHGYLLSQFLTPWNNRRSDAWGGDIENRARFPREVMRAVRDAAGPRTAVYPKLNMDDGFEGGLALHDGVEVGRMLERDGSVDALQLTGGHTTKTPFFLMRGGYPIVEMANNEKSWLRRNGMKFFARFLMQPYAFEEAWFLPSAQQFRAELSLPLMLLGGVTRLDTMDAAMDAGFEFLALGRALIREPDLVEKMESGRSTQALCDACNLCVAEMEKDGTRCVYRPS